MVPPYCIIDPPVNEFPPGPPSLLLQIIYALIGEGVPEASEIESVNVLPTVELPAIEADPPDGCAAVIDTFVLDQGL